MEEFNKTGVLIPFKAGHWFKLAIPVVEQVVVQRLNPF